ncbi:MAG TPA: DUF4397 domain-containing protein [Gemmatimonadales bacterium]|jgi:hypothetical protein|nr:DUF4397 domain-containing protein [Gemmatimonadales bacterium]
MTVRVTLLVTLALLAGCSSDSMTNDHMPFGARINLVNGATVAGTLKFYLDGESAGTVPVAQSFTTNIDPGDHTIEVRLGNGSLGFSRQVTVARNHSVTVVAFDSAGLLRPGVLADTNAIVPAGATKLRVAHYAQASSSIDIWRTQPDYSTPIRVQFPFNYLDVSPYLQSTVGDWQVFVSTPVAAPNDPLPDTLAVTPMVAIPDGQSRTVVVVDGPAGGVELVVISP